MCLLPLPLPLLLLQRLHLRLRVLHLCLHSLLLALPTSQCRGSLEPLLWQALANSSLLQQLVELRQAEEAEEEEEEAAAAAVEEEEPLLPRAQPPPLQLQLPRPPSWQQSR